MDYVNESDRCHKLHQIRITRTPRYRVAIKWQCKWRTMSNHWQTMATYVNDK